MQFVKYQCGECNTIFIADSRHHHLDYCPECGKTGIDLEEYHCGIICSKNDKFPHFKEAFNPPLFKDEDDYHSALLGWLNDSGEEFRLFKDNKILYIQKVR